MGRKVKIGSTNYEISLSDVPQAIETVVPTFTYAVEENTPMTVRLKSGDTFIRLPHRMLYVEDGEVQVTRAEYEMLRQMKVC